MSKKGIDFAHETGVKLIIILDCGIKAIKEIEYAKSLGIDFIICDHHVPDEVMPPAVAILNPKRPDDPFPFKHLCGCGVGFKFMQAFAKDNNIPFARLLCRKHRCRHRAGDRREPHPCLPWLEAAQHQSERGLALHHRHLRTQRTRDLDERHRLQDRSSHQRIGTYGEW